MMSDSARMNTWLHKEVLRKVAANGGNIPKERGLKISNIKQRDECPHCFVISNVA